MFTIETGSGFWNPLIWCIIAGVAFLIVYLLRSFGRTGFKSNTDQNKSFLSGNQESSDENHISSQNIYWGFTTSMRWLYTLLRKMHTGNTSDYVLYFVIILAIFLLLGVGVI